MGAAGEPGNLATRVVWGPGLAETRALELKDLVCADHDAVRVAVPNGLCLRTGEPHCEFGCTDTWPERGFDRSLVNAGRHSVYRDPRGFEERASHPARRGEDDRCVGAPDTRTCHVRRQ
jgi:hypothetical protein